MEEIINSVMQSPENTNPNVLRSQLQKMGGSGGGGVLIVTNDHGTLNKTMGEIQDAYLAGKQVIIERPFLGNVNYSDVIEMYPVALGKSVYLGSITTFGVVDINIEDVDYSVLAPIPFTVSGETEEAARNAYPEYLE